MTAPRLVIQHRTTSQIPRRHRSPPPQLLPRLRTRRHRCRERTTRRPPGDNPFGYPNSKEPDVQADALDVPDEIQKLRDADEARKLYPPEVTYRNTIPLAADASEQTKAAAREWASVFADVALSQPEAKAVVQLAENGLAQGIPTEEVRASWRATASENLRREHGVNAGKVLADAIKFVQRDPRLAAFLQASGLGDHPEVIQLAIAKSRK